MIELNEKNAKKIKITALPFAPKASDFEEFILWFAMPRVGKIKMGIETQEEFAKQYELAESTLTRWKDRPEFEARVRHLRKKWAFDKTGEVIEAIYKSSTKGNDRSQKLWMQVFEDFQEKSQVQHTLKVEVSPNDIRFLIEGLPEPLRTKHYDNFRDLIVDAEQVRRAGLMQDSTGTDGLTGEIRYEADQDARNIRDVGAHAVASRHSERVCEDMERTASESHHKSTAWWR